MCHSFCCELACSITTPAPAISAASSSPSGSYTPAGGLEEGRPTCGFAIVAPKPSQTITVTCSNTGSGVTVMNSWLTKTNNIINNKKLIIFYIEII